MSCNPKACGADIALVGNPNTGKSCLFNQLTTADAIVSNYPGTTVEILEGKTAIDNKVMHVADLPGIYNLGSSSDDERAATDYIIEKKPGVIVNVVDAALLERNLYLTLQLLELEVPMVIALNFYEELEDNGISIDYNNLSALLGVPVVPIDALRGAGIDILVKTIDTIMQDSYKFDYYHLKYDDHIEKAIDKITEIIEEENIPKRTASINLIEEDDVEWGKAGHKEEVRKIIDELSKEHALNTEIARERHGQAALLAQKVMIQGKPKKHFKDFLDRFTTEPLTGGISLVFIMGLSFFSLFTIGNYLSDLMGKWFDLLIANPLNPLIKAIPSTALQTVLTWGLQGINAGLQIALPYIFIFYLVLGALEDTGYLPRMAYLLDRLMHKMHLHGNAIIPMMLGFGCSVPAVLATRILPNKKDRILTSILICMIPCSARTAVIFGAVGKFIGAGYALLIFGIVLSLIFAVGYILGRFLPGESTGLIMEMSEYRLPQLKNVWKKTWMRVKDFIWVAFPLIIIGSVVLGLLKVYGVLEIITKPFAPIISGWLMLPAIAGITLVYGILRKEMALELLFVLGGSSRLLNFMTPLQIFIFTLVVALYFPCVGTLAVLKHEFGWKKSLAISLFTIALAVAIGGFVGRLFLIMGVPNHGNQLI
ncbi:MAG: ferrous iron transport protein B [Candidatus Omnitrophota bacterium]|nr:ferrous iron transport protein B [Candidatus Omnitrophota bacterium]